MRLHTNTQKDRKSKLVQIYQILSADGVGLEHINSNKALKKAVFYAKSNLKIIEVGRRYNKL